MNAYNTIKQTMKNLAITYAVVGSIAYQTAGLTGHQSADLATGISKPSMLEQFILEKLNLDTKQQ